MFCVMPCDILERQKSVARVNVPHPTSASVHCVKLPIFCFDVLCTALRHSGDTVERQKSVARADVPSPLLH